MPGSRKLFPACLLLQLFAAGATHADEYRGEVKGSFMHDRSDNDVIDHVNIWQLSGAYYFDPVKTDGVPLSEAAFLGKAGSLSANAVRIDIAGEQLDAGGASIDYYMPDTMFYGRLSVQRNASLRVSSVSSRTDHETVWSGAFGITPLEGLLLTTSATEHGWDPNVTARYVHKLPNGHFYAANVSFVDPDGGDSNVALDFDYFLDATFKIGAGYSEGGDKFTVRTEKFFTPRFALGAQAFTADNDDRAGIDVTWRF